MIRLHRLLLIFFIDGSKTLLAEETWNILCKHSGCFWTSCVGFPNNPTKCTDSPLPAQVCCLSQIIPSKKQGPCEHPKKQDLKKTHAGDSFLQKSLNVHTHTHAGYLEFLYFSCQRGVSANMLEERRFKANPQVGFLPVTVFLRDEHTEEPSLKETTAAWHSRSAYPHRIFLRVAHFDPHDVVQQPVDGFVFVEHEHKLHDERQVQRLEHLSCGTTNNNQHYCFIHYFAVSALTAGKENECLEEIH